MYYAWDKVATLVSPSLFRYGFASTDSATNRHETQGESETRSNRPSRESPHVRSARVPDSIIEQAEVKLQ